MASYFRQVPNFAYISRNKGKNQISQYTALKNLFKRAKLREDIFGNLSFFEKYSIVGDERPDNVAYKFYNDETLDWVVLIANNILNIQSEWPMTQRTFDKIMLEKYGSYENLYSGIHHYETKEIKNSLGIQILKSGINISPNWRSNGNFVEFSNTRIFNLYSGNGSTPSKTVTVEVLQGILGLQKGDRITIENVSENIYNGTFTVSDVIISYDNNTDSTSDDIIYLFTYELSEIPSVASPVLASPRKEVVGIELKGASGPAGSSYYYEYWDYGLEYSVLVPSSSFVNPITNYEYEMKIEEAKRNIYILKPRYLNIIFDDIQDIMKYKKGSQQYVTENLKKGDNIRLYE